MAILWDWHANSGDPPQAIVDFLEACMKGNTALLKQALANNVDVNTLHRCGLSGLIIAADSGNADIVEILLDNRANTCYEWSTKNALYYAEKNKDGRPGDSEEDLAQRKKTYLLLKERTRGEESDTAAPQLRQVGPVAGPKISTDFTTIVDRIPALVLEVADPRATAEQREVAAGILCEATLGSPDDEKHKELIVAAGGVPVLVEMLKSGPSPGAKEQAIAVLRNLARFKGKTDETGSYIRQVIRGEAEKWAGLGTAESEKRIKQVAEDVDKAGGVCYVMNDDEIQEALSSIEA